VAPSIKDVEFGGFIADKAFDADWIIAELNERGAKVVISQRPRLPTTQAPNDPGSQRPRLQRPRRKAPLVIDLDVHKWRRLIETFLCKLKEFKRIATRSDKTDTSFAAMIHLGAAIINSR